MWKSCQTRLSGVYYQLILIFSVCARSDSEHQSIKDNRRKYSAAYYTLIPLWMPYTQYTQYWKSDALAVITCHTVIDADWPFPFSHPSIHPFSMLLPKLKVIGSSGDPHSCHWAKGEVTSGVSASHF